MPAPNVASGSTTRYRPCLGEEPGWRGFALPGLLSHYGALAASLILGVLRALWHLPLVWTEWYPLYQQPVWLLLADVVAKSVIFTWVS